MSSVDSNTFTLNSPIPPMLLDKEAPNGQTQTMHRHLHTQGWRVGLWLSKIPVPEIALHPGILWSLNFISL